MVKPKITIREPVAYVECPKCKRIDYILGVGCKNCDLEVIKGGD